MRVLPAHVPLEVVGLTERQPAVRALVGPLAGVRPTVPPQVTHVFEHLAAHLTLSRGHGGPVLGGGPGGQGAPTTWDQLAHLEKATQRHGQSGLGWTALSRPSVIIFSLGDAR